MSDSDGEEAGVALVEMRPDELQDKIEAADNKLMALEMSIRSNAGSQRTIQEDINDKISVQRKLLDRSRAEKRKLHQRMFRVQQERERAIAVLGEMEGKKQEDSTTMKAGMEAGIVGDALIEKLEGGSLRATWRHRWVLASPGELRIWYSMTRPNVGAIEPVVTLPLRSQNSDMRYFSKFEKEFFKREHGVVISTRCDDGVERSVTLAFRTATLMRRWAVTLLDCCEDDEKVPLSLFRAAQRGELKAVERQLSTTGGNVNTCNAHNMTALHYAARSAVATRDEEQLKKLHNVIALLLRRGADPHLEDNMGRTVFTIAKGNRILEALIKRNLSRVKAQDRLNSAEKKGIMLQLATRQQKQQSSDQNNPTRHRGHTMGVTRERRVQARASVTSRWLSSGTAATSAHGQVPRKQQQRQTGGTRNANTAGVAQYWATRAQGFERARARMKPKVDRVPGATVRQRPASAHPAFKSSGAINRPSSSRSHMRSGISRDGRGSFASARRAGQQRPQSAHGNLRRMSQRTDTTIADARYTERQKSRPVSAVDLASRHCVAPSSLTRPLSAQPRSRAHRSRRQSFVVGPSMARESLPGSSRNGGMATADGAEIDPAANVPPGMVLTLSDGKEISFDTRRALAEAMQALAPDDSGVIATKELCHLLASNGLPLDWDEQQELVAEADPQNTGYINIDAFSEHLLSERKRMEDFKQNCAARKSASRGRWAASASRRRG